MKKAVLFMLAVALLYPSNLMAGLQVDILLNNVFARFQSIIAERGGDPGSISRDDMVLEQNIPFEVELSGQKVTLHAVKVVISDLQAGQKQHVTLIVDETGVIQLDGALAELSTGRSIHQDVMDELVKIKEDPGVGDLLFQGSGEANVLYLSDPFCPYCRHAYAYLLDQKDRINEFRIAHFPVNPNSGAVALTYLMKEYKEEDNYQDVVDFAYELDRALLTGNADHSVLQVFNEKFRVYTQTPEAFFDYLKQKYQDSLAGDMEKMRGIGLSGTPVIIIDGIRVDGFNRDRIDDLLGQ